MGYMSGQFLTQSITVVLPTVTLLTTILLWRSKDHSALGKVLTFVVILPSAIAYFDHLTPRFLAWLFDEPMEGWVLLYVLALTIVLTPLLTAFANVSAAILVHNMLRNKANTWIWLGVTLGGPVIAAYVDNAITKADLLDGLAGAQVVNLYTVLFGVMIMLCLRGR